MNGQQSNISKQQLQPSNRVSANGLLMPPCEVEEFILYLHHQQRSNDPTKGTRLLECFKQSPVFQCVSPNQPVTRLRKEVTRMLTPSCQIFKTLQNNIINSANMNQDNTPATSIQAQQMDQLPPQNNSLSQQESSFPDQSDNPYLGKRSQPEASQASLPGQQERPDEVAQQIGGSVGRFSLRQTRVPGILELEPRGTLSSVYNPPKSQLSPSYPSYEPPSPQQQGPKRTIDQPSTQSAIPLEQDGQQQPPISRKDPRDGKTSSSKGQIKNFNKRNSVIMGTRRTRAKTRSRTSRQKQAQSLSRRGTTAVAEQIEAKESKMEEAEEDDEYTSILFDTSIKRGAEYQAALPDKYTGDFSRNYPTFDVQSTKLSILVEVDNFSLKDSPATTVKGRKASKSNAAQEELPSSDLLYSRKLGSTLVVELEKRNSGRQIAWDPKVSSTQEFVDSCFFLGKHIKENYGLFFSRRDFLDYFEICNMNLNLFCATIYNDLSPFIDFVQRKRTKS